MQQLYLLAVGGVLLVLSTTSFGQQKPLAPWGVHAVVTLGRTTYEGDKIRAVLEYGETGNPTITLESIHVDMGNPSPNRVVWTAEIDVTGESPDPCPVAEFYCAVVQDLAWVGDTLNYKVVAPSAILHCQVEYILTRAPKTRCDVKKGTVGPLS